MKTDFEYEEKPVNFELNRTISRVVDGIIISPHLFFVYDMSNHVHMVYGPEKRNERLSRNFGRGTHLSSSIEVVAPYLVDNEAHVEVLKRLGEPDTCETDIEGNRNFRYNISPQRLTYLLYIVLWSLEKYHHLSFRRMYETKKDFDGSLVERLSRI